MSFNTKKDIINVISKHKNNLNFYSHINTTENKRIYY